MLVSTPPTPAAAQTATDSAQTRLVAAAAIQGATRARLGVLGDAFTCADARFASFRRSDAQPDITDQWYVASQLWADADLIALAAPPATSPAPGPSQVSSPPEAPLTPGSSSPPILPNWDAQDSRCYLDKGFVFLDRLWDYNSAGYFPRSDPVGGSVDNTERYADDNLLAGLAQLATAATTTDPLEVRRYLHAAQREADFLTDPGTGMWDTTFGGGFWWRTSHGDTDEGKPAQTNALAGLFFGRLYQATGDPSYREWALRSLLWLDTVLFDPSRGLYRWSVGFQDLTHRTGAVIHQRFFNYDQSIAIQAELLAAQLDGDQNRIARARGIGQAIQTAFWSSDRGSYNLESGVDQVFTSYAAWTSLGHLALYATDHDPAWLAMAEQNSAALDADLRESDAGYAYRSYRCVDRLAQGCESGQVTHVVDHMRDTSAQAWMQHLEEAVAADVAQSAVSQPTQP